MSKPWHDNAEGLRSKYGYSNETRPGKCSVGFSLVGHINPVTSVSTLRVGLQYENGI
jgi:hypothetical protein